MNSVLNPEAPEFYPKLIKLKDEAIEVAKAAVVSAKKFPSRKNSLYRTFPEFIVIQTKFRQFVMSKANEIMDKENPAGLLNWEGDHDSNTDKVIDVTDNFLDRININIDTMEGVFGASAAVGRDLQTPSCSHSPVTATIKVNGETATLIGAKNIPRPQIMFKYPVDNSSRLFVPRISDKPNSMRPLALNILYDNVGQPIGYEHPYKMELEAWQLPDDLQEPEGVWPLPPSVEKTPLTLVDTEPRFEHLLRVLLRTREFAVDLEHHSYRTYQGITCLIQISTDTEDFIIDALALREQLHKLNLTFTDPNKLKVFHGADHDVLWLQRDFGVYVVGMFDTHQAARLLRLSRLSLQFLLQHYCKIVTDKKYQMADWRMRPLPAELLRYARTDTHYLLYIWRYMRRELLAVDTSPPQLLLAAIDNSRRICGLTYKKEVLREDSHMPLYLRSKKTFTTGQLAALRLLYRWRDCHAREEDESPLYLLPNQMLLTLAETLPRELQGISMLCSPMPPFLKQHVETVHRIILSCRQIPDEPRIFSKPPSMMGILVPPSSVDETVHDFKHYPDRSTEPINLDAALEVLAAHPDRCVRADVTLFDPDAPEFVAPPVPPELAYILYKGRKPPVHAKSQEFLPPFERYKIYRILRQKEEVKALREKEAKVAAISNGNELIWEEVLMKMERARLERAQEGDARPGPSAQTVDAVVKPVYSERKRVVPVDADVKQVVALNAKVKPAVPVDANVKPVVPVVKETNSSQRKRKITDKLAQNDTAGRTADTKNTESRDRKAVQAKRLRAVALWKMKRGVVPPAVPTVAPPAALAVAPSAASAVAPPPAPAVAPPPAPAVAPPGPPQRAILNPKRRLSRKDHDGGATLPRSRITDRCSTSLRKHLDKFEALLSKNLIEYLDEKLHGAGPKVSTDVKPEALFDAVITVSEWKRKNAAKSTGRGDRTAAQDNRGLAAALPWPLHHYFLNPENYSSSDSDSDNDVWKDNRYRIAFQKELKQHKRLLANIMYDSYIEQMMQGLRPAPPVPRLLRVSKSPPPAPAPAPVAHQADPSLRKRALGGSSAQQSARVAIPVPARQVEANKETNDRNSMKACSDLSRARAAPAQKEDTRPAPAAPRAPRAPTVAANVQEPNSSQRKRITSDKFTQAGIASRTVGTNTNTMVGPWFENHSSISEPTMVSIRSLKRNNRLVTSYTIDVFNS